MGLYDILQNALYVGIEDVHAQLATLCSSQNGLVLLGLSGLQHVVAGLHGFYGIIASVPVGYIHTFPAPFIANDGRQQLVVLYGIRTVQLIIRGHDGPRVALLDHDLKSFQIDLTECALRYLRDIAVTVGFLIVGHEVLRTGSGAFALYTLYIACCNRA